MTRSWVLLYRPFPTPHQRMSELAVSVAPVRKSQVNPVLTSRRGHDESDLRCPDTSGAESDVGPVGGRREIDGRPPDPGSRRVSPLVRVRARLLIFQGK